LRHVVSRIFRIAPGEQIASRSYGARNGRSRTACANAGSVAEAAADRMRRARSEQWHTGADEPVQRYVIAAPSFWNPVRGAGQPWAGSGFPHLCEDRAQKFL